MMFFIFQHKFMFLCRASNNVFLVFSSPNNNFLIKIHLFRPERQTVENVRFWARFWSQKSPKINFSLFLQSKQQKAHKMRFGRKSAIFFAKSCVFLLRRRSFCAHGANVALDNAFLGILKPIFTLCALFRSFLHFLAKK